MLSKINDCDNHMFALVFKTTCYVPDWFLDVNDESVGYMLRVLYPRLEAQVMVAKHVQLIEPLQEIQIHEGDTSFLQPQCHFILGEAKPCFLTFLHSQTIPHMSSHKYYIRCSSFIILENAESLKEEIKRQPSMIERLYGTHCFSNVVLFYNPSLLALISDLYVDRAALKVGRWVLGLAYCLT